MEKINAHAINYSSNEPFLIIDRSIFRCNNTCYKCILWQLPLKTSKEFMYSCTLHLSDRCCIVSFCQLYNFGNIIKRLFWIEHDVMMYGTYRLCSALTGYSLVGCLGTDEKSFQSFHLKLYKRVLIISCR